MSNSTAEYMRIKSMLLADKVNSPMRFENAIKNDVFTVLKSYMDISPSDVSLNIAVTESGFEVKISGKAARLKF